MQPDAVQTPNKPLECRGILLGALKLASHSVGLYQDWTAQHKSAELHLYAKGGHGFGMRTQNLPTDRWIERFHDWLGAQGLTGK